MKWFEEHKELMAGADDEVPGSSYSAIAQISNEALGENEMVQFVRDEFPSQKAFGEFLGVGESTVAGWMKSGSFPDYAKRATLAAYYSNKYFRQIRDAKRDAARPKVIKDGDRYSIVQFRIDEAGVTMGKVLARDIPTKKAALLFAGGLRAWELLSETEHLIDLELESMNPEDSAWIQELKEEIGMERARTFRHDELLELERKHKEVIESLNLDDLLSVEPTKKADNIVEDREDGDV